VSVLVEFQPVQPPDHHAIRVISALEAGASISAALMPTLSRIKTRMQRRLRGRPDPKADAAAGLTVGIASVPDGMAASVLAGVNPVHGLYAAMTGSIVGGLTARTQLMVVTTTSAAALAAGEALSGLSGEERTAALALLVVLAGVLQLAAGLLRLGRFTRFVSHSVMKAFLLGIAVLIVLGQLPGLAGAEVEGDNALERAFDLLVHPGRIHLASLAIGLAALFLVVLLVKTRLHALAALAAVAIPSLVVWAFDAGGVAVVGDVPSGLPTPHLPPLAAFSLDLLTGAAALAAIVLVQGAGVAESVPTKDASPDADFRAQGYANIASGLVRGLPVGGSLGQTALNVSGGARTRCASVGAGICLALVLLVFSGLVAHVVMPALAALLLVAAWGTIDLPEAVSIWRTGTATKIIAATTFAATVFLPIQAAVGIGIVLSALIYLNRAATDVRLVELVRRDDGRLEERALPPTLPGGEVTIVNVYGSVFYAGARTLQERLPRPEGERPVVVLRLRGHTKLGATFVEVLAGYADELADAGGRLYLAGVDHETRALIERTRKLSPQAAERIFEATPIIGEATERAFAAGEAWLVASSPRDDAPSATLS
jgi:SulP family sulfate permease